MTLVLTLVGLSVVLTFVSAVLLASVLRDEPPERSNPRIQPDAGRPAFFGYDVPRRRGNTASTVPVEVLLLQLERHVRLEHAAAESFHLSPTAAALHMPTASPLIH
jgi:hypothetical protein